MAYRFTNTDKWSDAWFSELKPNEKLLFIYLCDNCDIAGFIELTPKKWAFDLGLDVKIISGALLGLERGLIHSNTNDCIFIRNFLKHQKNLPLNEKNNAHLGIIKRFNDYKNKFNIENIETFINQEVKPLARGYGNGKGNGNGLGNGKNAQEIFFKNQETFKKEILSYRLMYDEKMLEAFYDYWTEPNKTKTKMKWELQQTFDISRRLKTWSNNNFGKNGKQTGKSVFDRGASIADIQAAIEANR